MRKLLLPLSLFILVFSLFPGVIFADQKYYNEIYNFSLEIDDGWYLFQESYFDTISPDEKKSLVEGFVYSDGKSKIFIKAYDKNQDKSKRFKELIQYAKDTPPDDRDFTRLLSPIKVEAGDKIEKFLIDEKANRVLFEFQESKDSIKRIVQWQFLDQDLLEIEMVIYEKKIKDIGSDNSVFKKIKYPASHNENSVEQSQIDTENTQKESTTKEQLDIDEIFGYLLDKTLWIILGIVCLITLLIFIFKK